MPEDRIATIRRMVKHHRTFRNEVHGLIDLYHQNHELTLTEAIALLQSIRKELAKKLTDGGFNAPEI